MRRNSKTFQYFSFFVCSFPLPDGLKEDLDVAHIEIGSKTNELGEELKQDVDDTFAALPEKGWKSRIMAIFNRAADAIDAGQSGLASIPEISQLAENSEKKLRAESSNIAKGKSSPRHILGVLKDLYRDFNEALANLYGNRNKNLAP